MKKRYLLLPLLLSVGLVGCSDPRENDPSCSYYMNWKQEKVWDCNKQAPSSQASQPSFQPQIETEASAALERQKLPKCGPTWGDSRLTAGCQP